jgi:hypothetical protein
VGVGGYVWGEWVLFIIITGVSIYERGMVGRHEITWEIVAAFSCGWRGEEVGVGNGMGAMKPMFTGR